MTMPCVRSLQLTPNQMEIWALISRGLPVIYIAKKLETTRQYVNQTPKATESKLTLMLLEVAKINDLQNLKINTQKAMFLRQRTIIAYTISHGTKVWYGHENSALFNGYHYRRRLEDFEEMSSPPGRMANSLFWEIFPELRN